MHTPWKPTTAGIVYRVRYERASVIHKEIPASRICSLAQSVVVEIEITQKSVYFLSQTKKEKNSLNDIFWMEWNTGTDYAQPFALIKKKT